MLFYLEDTLVHSNVLEYALICSRVRILTGIVRGRGTCSRRREGGEDMSRNSPDVVPSEALAVGQTRADSQDTL